jgi:hypothetical protein
VRRRVSTGLEPGLLAELLAEGGAAPLCDTVSEVVRRISTGDLFG